jgi:hypothetical protein
MIPTRVRTAVAVRSLGRCERCFGTGQEIHHRRPRGMGGGDGREHAIENLVRLCRSCHRWATVEPSQAIRAGWVVPHTGEHRDLSTARLALLNQVWVTLSPSGVYRVGSLVVRNLAEIQSLLAAVRRQGVVPADPLGGLEPTVPAAGVVGERPRANKINSLSYLVRSTRIPAGALGYGRKDVAEFRTHLVDRDKSVDRVRDVVEGVE